MYEGVCFLGMARAAVVVVVRICAGTELCGKLDGYMGTASGGVSKGWLGESGSDDCMYGSMDAEAGRSRAAACVHYW